MRPKMRNLRKLLRQTSTKVTRVQKTALWKSKAHLVQGYRQLKLSKGTNREVVSSQMVETITDTTDSNET